MLMEQISNSIYSSVSIRKTKTLEAQSIFNVNIIRIMINEIRQIKKNGKIKPKTDVVIYKL